MNILIITHHQFVNTETIIIVSNIILLNQKVISLKIYINKICRILSNCLVAGCIPCQEAVNLGFGNISVKIDKRGVRIISNICEY